jgi:lipopolysaccharide transport system ATP-binding protein
MGRIVVSGLGKAYKQYGSRWSRLGEWLGPASARRHQLKWVLRDINFTVESGEALGIVGINGAGKSTLLKLITGTSQASVGCVAIEGRVAALLELGMGFHPDFTGRQNARMAAQLLGITAQEIDQLMPSIEAFAEIGDSIDQPLRIYSSGMQMRLAFSVATAVRPDVLIVDEALSVGDALFQQKSFDRIRGFRAQGTTLLLVSHDKQAVLNLCDRALLLKDGAIARMGPSQEVLDYYNALLSDQQNQTIQQIRHDNGVVQTVSGNGQAAIVSAVLTDVSGCPVELIEVGTRVQLKVEAQAHQPLPELVLGFMIKDRLGQAIFGTNSHHVGQVVHDVQAGQNVRYLYEFPVALGPGHYSIALALHTQDTHIEHNYEWRDQALHFEVVNHQHDEFVGIAWLNPTLRLEP